MLLRVSVWPALRMATPLALVLGLILNTILGPNAMPLQALGSIFAESSGYRLALLGFWAVGLCPATQVALRGPGLRYLRWLPMPRYLGPGLFLSLLILLHLPFFVLFAAAGNPAMASAFLGCGIGVSAILVPAPYSRWQQLLLGALLAAVLALLHEGAWLLASLGGGALAAVRAPAVWRQAGSQSRRRARVLLFGGPLLSLCSAALLHIGRRESALMLRALFLTLLAMGLVALLARANPAGDLLTIALVASTPFWAACALMFGLGLQRWQREQRWLSLSLGIGAGRLVLASCLALALLLAIAALAVVAVALALSTVSLWLVPAALLQVLLWTSLAHLLIGAEALGSRAAMWGVLLVVANMIALGLAGVPFFALQLALSLWALSRLPSRVPEELAHARA